MKYLVALLCAVLTTSVMADEEVVTGVADRMTCADIQERISELEEKVENTEKEVLSQFISLLDSKKYDYVEHCGSARNLKLVFFYYIFLFIFY